MSTWYYLIAVRRVTSVAKPRLSAQPRTQLLRFSKVRPTTHRCLSKHPHLSVVWLLKNFSGRLFGADFPLLFGNCLAARGRIIQSSEARSTLLQKNLSFFAKRFHGTPIQASVTRANLRLPTWSTTVSPAFRTRLLSASFSPFRRTPPCSIMRSAAEVLATSSACFMT